MDTTELFRLADGEGRSGRTGLRVRLLGALALACAGLALFHGVWAGPQDVRSLLFGASALWFALGACAGPLSRLAAVSAPWICLGLCFGLAFLDGDLHAPALYWVPFLPLLASASASRPGYLAAAVAGAAGLAIVGLWATAAPPAPGGGRSDETLRAGALALAVALGAYLAMVQDQDREERRRRLWRKASHHPLTGLKSREFFMELLKIAVDRAARGNGGLGLIFIDLDGLKEINDRWGHWAGDVFLKESARRIASSTRAGDVPCHLGGDEFVVVLEPCPDGEELMRLAERVLVALRKEIPMESENLKGSASLGIARFEASETVEDLVRRADRAMCRVKHQGGNGYCLDRPDGVQEPEPVADVAPTPLSPAS